MKIMRKPYFLFSTAVLVMTAFIAKAELPPLSDSPAIVSLPHTFSISDRYGSIDINRDGIKDFYVDFDSYGSSGGGSKYCNIRGSIYGNSLLAEYILPPGAPQSDVLPPLSVSSIAYATLLERGTLVGTTAPIGSYWQSNAFVFDQMGAPKTPLHANFTDGLYSGYVGTYFGAGSNNHYGWLNVSIDPNENFVTINSAGYNPAPATPIPAGLNDPFAVPIPLIASILGFGLIGGGAYLRKRKKK